MITVIDESILIPPYGGKLIDLTVPRDRAGDLKARASGLPSVQLSERAACDLELLATGAFSPLDRFMGEDDYRRTVGEMRLGDGTVFPIPVTLPVDDPSSIKLDGDVALRDSRNELLAVMTVREAYEWGPAGGGGPGVRHPGRPAPPRVGDAPLGQGQYLRPAAGPAASAAPRFHRSEEDALRDARESGRVRPLQRRGVPDPESPPQGARGAHEEGRRERGRSPPASPGGRAHQTGRRRPLHARSHLPGAGPALLREGQDPPVAPAAGDEACRAQGGAVARHHTAPTTAPTT